MSKQQFQQSERFSRTHITDAEDRLDTANLKLRAITNVTMDSNLECLGDGNPEGESLRYGLGLILLDIADEHERNIQMLKADWDRCNGARRLSPGAETQISESSPVAGQEMRQTG